MTNPDSSVFTATDYLTYLRSIGRVADIKPPKSLILCFQKELLNYVSRKYSKKEINIFGCELILLMKYNQQIGVIGGFGVGSPATATVIDLFCSLGVQQFFIIGMAGGLQTNLQAGSLVLSSGAIRAEGTSRHYLPENEIVESDSALLNGLSSSLTSKKIIHSRGITWTTDTPFREMKSQVIAYQERGVLAVDMEAAAMLAVAETNHGSGLAAFSISDSLANGKWVMPKDLSPSRNGLFILFESLIDFLAEQKATFD